jgi:hypothetical protein
MVTDIHSRTGGRREWLPQSTLLYEDEYIWLAILSAIDVVLTYFYLQFGGQLISPFVDAVLNEAGLYGLLVIKLLSVAIVVMGCETLGHRRSALGRKVITIVNLLAVVAVTHVVYAMALHYWFFMS